MYDKSRSIFDLNHKLRHKKDNFQEIYIPSHFIWYLMNVIKCGFYFHFVGWKYLNPSLYCFLPQELNEDDKIMFAACWSFNYNKNAGICRLFYFRLHSSSMVFIYVLEVMCKNLNLTYKLLSHYINCLSGYSDNHKGTVFFWNSA